jgi:DNA-binding CsgD family transcriptional regulator
MAAMLGVPVGVPLRALCTLLPVSDAPPRALLQPAELAVLRELARGRTEREAAEVLHLSYSYTRRLAAAAAHRLGANGTRNAIYLATRARLI